MVSRTLPSQRVHKPVPPSPSSFTPDTQPLTCSPQVVFHLPQISKLSFQLRKYFQPLKVLLTLSDEL